MALLIIILTSVPKTIPEFYFIIAISIGINIGIILPLAIKDIYDYFQTREVLYEEVKWNNQKTQHSANTKVDV